MIERERGFALIIVLWSVGLLSLLATQLVATGRTELQIATNVRRAATLDAQVDGVVYGTVFRLMGESVADRAVDGRAHPFTLPGTTGTVRVTSLAGKLNPNTAATPVLAALLEQAGAPAGQAAALANAIADWRTPGAQGRAGTSKQLQYRAAGLPYTPPGAAFQSVDELGFVLGMPAGLAARVAPHLTVYYPGETALAAAAADPAVAAVLKATGTGDPNLPAEGSEKDAVYVAITVEAANREGARRTRTVLAWVGHGALRGSYRILQIDPPP